MHIFISGIKPIEHHTQTQTSILCSPLDQLVQMSATQHSISTALVTKLLVIEQLLHPALKFAASPP